MRGLALLCGLSDRWQVGRFRAVTLTVVHKKTQSELFFPRMATWDSINMPRLTQIESALETRQW